MPTPIATRTWSGESRSETAGEKAVDTIDGELWLVRDATSRAQALAAVGLPIINQEFTPGSPLRVRSRHARPKDGPTTWEVQVDYGVPPNGQYPTQNLDPLQRPQRISWRDGRKQIPMEQDLSKRLIRNSAGTIFAPPTTREVWTETLTIRQFEPFFDRARARRYRNKVNRNPFIVGNTTILPYESLCARIGPTGEYEANAAYLEIEYVFEIEIEERASEDQSGEPFSAHIPDAGRFGWYTDSGGKPQPGFFCTYQLNGSTKQLLAILTEPILLNGKGQPLRPPTPATPTTLIGVADQEGSTAKVYDAAESPPEHHLTDDYTSLFSTDAVKMWLIARNKSVDFSGIFV